MEFSSRHFAHLPRRFAVHPPVQGIGHIPAKDSWVRHAFDTFNYSLILRGGGLYRRGGREWRVEPPCVITQWPGEYVEYGPAEPHRFWEEVFMLYRAADLAYLIEHALVDPERPVWRIRDPDRLTAKLSELAELTHAADAPGAADRIDAACMGAVMESHLARHAPPADANEETIRRVRSHLQSHLHSDVDVDGLTAELGMSGSTFRRHWARHVDVPPARYLMRLRIREARRLLVETPLSVGQIADRLRFTDPLYFSRKFRRETGMSATEYRRMHRIEAH